MHLGFGGAELAHVAEHGDAAAGCGRGEVVEGGTHRHWVGVVAVVDDRDLPRDLDPLAAQLGELDLDATVRSDADRARRGERGAGVAAQVRGEQRLAACAQLEAGEVPVVDPAAGAEGDGLDVASDVGREQRLPEREHGGAAGRERGDERGLLGGDRLHRAHLLEVDGAQGGDDPHLGLGDPGELGDLPAPAHAHLEHEHLGADGRAEDRQRQPDLGVEVALVGDDAELLAEHRAQEILGRRLADAAGDADDRAGQGAAPVAGQALQRVERVVRREDHGVVGGLGVAGADEHAPGAGGERLLGEGSAVGVLAGQPDEEVAGADRAGVDRHAARHAVARALRGGAVDRRPRDLGDALRRPRLHGRAPPWPPSRRRRAA